jgi:rRNA maturation endonuclease Nob1
MTSCESCRIQFAQELEKCPLCGAKPTGQYDELDEVH